MVDDQHPIETDVVLPRGPDFFESPLWATTREVGLRGMHPGWFGVVMGTGIVGISASLNPGNFAALASSSRTLGQFMVILAVVVACVLVVLFLCRIFLHADAAMADLRDPVVGAAYATLPVALMVLGVAAVTVGPTWFSAPTVRDIVILLDWVSVPMAFIGSLVLRASAL